MRDNDELLVIARALDTVLNNSHPLAIRAVSFLLSSSALIPRSAEQTNNPGFFELAMLKKIKFQQGLDEHYPSEDH